MLFVCRLVVLSKLTRPTCLLVPRVVMAVRCFIAIRPETNGRPAMTIGSESATKQNRTRDDLPALCPSVYLNSQCPLFTGVSLLTPAVMGRDPPSKSQRVVVGTRRRESEAKGGRFLAFSEGGANQCATHLLLPNSFPLSLHYTGRRTLRQERKKGAAAVTATTSSSQSHRHLLDSLSGIRSRQ